LVFFGEVGVFLFFDYGQLFPVFLGVFHGFGCVFEFLFFSPHFDMFIFIKHQSRHGTFSLFVAI